MIDDLNLPNSDSVPDMKPKRLPATAYDKWVTDNFKCLQQEGLLGRIRSQQSRQPSAVRFRLV